MLKLYSELEENLYQPNTCAIRWTRDFYVASHPIFGGGINANSAVLQSSTSIVKKKTVAEVDKYKKSFSLANFAGTINNAR